MDIGNESGVIPVLALLLVFGVAYNLVVTWLIRHGYDEGYTWALVVVGVLVTLIGLALIAPNAVMLALAAFAASGAPMAVGSWWRHVRNRRHGQESQRSDVLR
jgi:predicted tellurium resistance membrane protein TerC